MCRLKYSSHRVSVDLVPASDIVSWQKASVPANTRKNSNWVMKEGWQSISSPDYVPSIFVFKGTKLNRQILSCYERCLARKAQSGHGEKRETSSVAHCGEVNDFQQFMSESLSGTNG